jgi:dimethylargininase
MLLALTHVVSPSIADCELTFVERSRIDYTLATQQHRDYCKLLSKCGLQVIELSVNSGYPDSTFIEDTAVVFDELAIIASMGTESRRGEISGVEAELAKYRDITRIELPATLEGGDVVRVGGKVFAGISPRTNSKGIESLKQILDLQILG